MIFFAALLRFPRLRFRPVSTALPLPLWGEEIVVGFDGGAGSKTGNYQADPNPDGMRGKTAKRLEE